MRRLLFIPFCAALLIVPAGVLAGGGETGFSGIVHSIESQYHVHATHIPFLGLVSFTAGRATHDSVRNLHIAEFEGFSASLDGEELNRMVEQKLGSGWERVVRETSRSGQEQTLVYMHPEGDRMGMFVLDADGHDLDVVQLSVDPQHMGESLGRYAHMHGDETRDGDPE